MIEILIDRRHKQQLLLEAGRRSRIGVSHDATCIFRCPACGEEMAAAAVSKSGNTLAVRCRACKLMAFDYDYKEDKPCVKK